MGLKWKIEVTELSLLQLQPSDHLSLRPQNTSEYFTVTIRAITKYFSLELSPDNKKPRETSMSCAPTTAETCYLKFWHAAKKYIYSLLLRKVNKQKYPTSNQVSIPTLSLHSLTKQNIPR